jgi:D-galactarolactone isomerase
VSATPDKAVWQPGQPVPNSAGMARPKLQVPPGACDAHIHVIDPRFPMPVPVDMPGMTFDDYLVQQARLGTERFIAVQAKLHGTNHDCLVDALQRGGGSGRGIAVVHPDVSDAELRRLDAAGVRGLRFSLWKASDTVTTIDMVAPLAKRIAALGWHAQIHMSADQIVAARHLLDGLPCPIVFDHMGRLPPREGPAHPAFAVIRALLDRGRTWLKLSGTYLNTEAGGPTYPDITPTAQAFVAAAPERLVWGSDWPHVTEAHKPDDAGLLDLLGTWCSTPTQIDRILVGNAADLYGFGAEKPRNTSGRGFTEGR